MNQELPPSGEKVYNDPNNNSDPPLRLFGIKTNIDQETEAQTESFSW